ncbi:MAG: hypothetical protein ACI89J_003621 [Hyphomicrobiaceae bacterium]|jgi:hypothetical protein
MRCEEDESKVVSEVLYLRNNPEGLFVGQQRCTAAYQHNDTTAEVSAHCKKLISKTI